MNEKFTVQCVEFYERTIMKKTQKYLIEIHILRNFKDEKNNSLIDLLDGKPQKFSNYEKF